MVRKVVIVGKLHWKKNLLKFTVKYRQYLIRWLPEFYSEKYGSHILGFIELFKFTVENRISLTNTMLIYQPFS